VSHLPAVTVAAVIEKDGKYLMVEEHDQHGNLIYNQPAGHLEPNEDILQAMIREVYEETGLAFEPVELIGTYLLESERTGKSYLRFCFSGKIPEDQPLDPQDSDIIQAVWMTLEEIIEKRKHWRSDIVRECLEDYENGHRFPLTLVKSYMGINAL
jgi:phosphatase NudJ